MEHINTKLQKTKRMVGDLHEVGGNKIAALEELLRNGTDIQQYINENPSIFHDACLKGDLMLLQWLADQSVPLENLKNKSTFLIQPHDLIKTILPIICYRRF